MYRNKHIGGGICSICKAPGVNKSTCPLNPGSKTQNLKNITVVK